MEFKSELQARNYLAFTDFYFTVDKAAQLTDERKTELQDNREDARQFIRSVSGDE